MAMHPTLTKPLAQVPIDQLVSIAIERLRSATLDELGALLAGRPTIVPTVEHLAELIVAMPLPGSKLAPIEQAVVQRAIDTAGGNVSEASRLLQMDRKSLDRKISRARRSR